MDPLLTPILQTIQEQFGAVLQEFRDQAILIVAPEKIVEVARALRDEYGFALLSDETAVDYGSEASDQEVSDQEVRARFHVVYQLRDVTRNLLVTLRVPLPGVNPRVASLVPLYPGAGWLEREVYDMFGITFEGHPDLRRIIMPYDWEGHPLRKDYPLGYEEVQFTFNQAEIMARKPHPED
jgi:NADH-quinone oxidoreductase subunit C